jgi:DNA replication protein DnaC
MLTQPTIEKLRTLRLAAMAAAWEAQREDAKIHELDFDARFGMLVDAEHLSRENKRLTKALRDAKLRIGGACVEDIDYAPKRELDRATIKQLATCAWVASHANVIITGATGTGKSYVACALAQQACRRGYRALYRRMPRLLEELALAHADGTYTRLLGRFAKIDVLVLDDWGATCSRSSKTGTARGRRSSRANCPSKSGTTTSQIRQSPTRFSIASCTTHTGSN